VGTWPEAPADRLEVVVSYGGARPHAIIWRRCCKTFAKPTDLVWAVPQAAYSVIEVVCDVFCPGEHMELLDALVASHRNSRRASGPLLMSGPFGDGDAEAGRAEHGLGVALGQVAEFSEQDLAVLKGMAEEAVADGGGKAGFEHHSPVLPSRPGMLGVRRAPAPPPQPRPPPVLPPRQVPLPTMPQAPPQGLLGAFAAVHQQQQHQQHQEAVLRAALEEERAMFLMRRAAPLLGGEPHAAFAHRADMLARMVAPDAPLDMQRAAVERQSMLGGATAGGPWLAMEALGRRPTVPEEALILQRMRGTGAVPENLQSVYAAGGEGGRVPNGVGLHPQGPGASGATSHTAGGRARAGPWSGSPEITGSLPAHLAQALCSRIAPSR
jgi:hypothetical protein